MDTRRATGSRRSDYFATAPAVPEAWISGFSPHVVLILIDDMGHGDLKGDNQRSNIPMPHLDRLSRDCSANGCDAVTMTGLCPFHTSVGVWRTQPLIKQGQVTISTLLKEQGRRTAMVGKGYPAFHGNGRENPLPGGPGRRRIR